jgi:hypothetical protein
VTVVRHFIICKICYVFHRGLLVAANQCGCALHRLDPVDGFYGDALPAQG